MAESTLKQKNGRFNLNRSIANLLVFFKLDSKIESTRATLEKFTV